MHWERLRCGPDPVPHCLRERVAPWTPPSTGTCVGSTGSKPRSGCPPVAASCSGFGICRHFFSDDPQASGRLARWWGIATVTPATNVTGLNLRYQAYLNLVFHRTRLARMGHAICMPLIVAACLAALCPLRLGSWPALPGLALPVNASLPAAIGLAVWWAIWAVKERDAVWGACGVALAAALYVLARSPTRHVRRSAASRRRSAARSPGCCSDRCCRPARTSWSRCRPGFPARRYWIPVREYVFGPPRSPYGPKQVMRRCGHLAAQTVFGTVDELVASPRLLPVLLLESLWLIGHRPHQRAAYRAMAANAIASGNPAWITSGPADPPRCAFRSRQGR